MFDSSYMDVRTVERCKRSGLADSVLSDAENLPHVLTSKYRIDEGALQSPLSVFLNGPYSHTPDSKYTGSVWPCT